MWLRRVQFHKLSLRTRVWVLIGAAVLAGILGAGRAFSTGVFPYRAMSSGRTPPARPASPSESAYFMFDYPPNPETFIFELTDPAKIQEARNILSGLEGPRHIQGTIIKQPAVYNPPWSYHLDPASISFFTNAIEVCDATIQYVEDHLDEVCGAFLPNCAWCPWNSRLLSEVFPQGTSTPTATSTATVTNTPPVETPTSSPSPTPTRAPQFIYLPILEKRGYFSGLK